MEAKPSVNIKHFWDPQVVQNMSCEQCHSEDRASTLTLRTSSGAGPSTPGAELIVLIV